MTHPATRKQIIDAADQLIYQRGYEFTSFADIAKVVKISRGNFYYHFKSKDEILAAVIEARYAKTQALLDRWEREGADAQERILSFIGILIANRSKIMRFGCPVGTLCGELAKLEHGLQSQANLLFTLFRGWLRRQFVALGCKENADALALHLLARSQGVATLANAYQDAAFVDREVALMREWLSSVAASGIGFTQSPPTS